MGRIEAFWTEIGLILFATAGALLVLILLIELPLWLLSMLPGGPQWSLLPVTGPVWALAALVWLVLAGALAAFGFGESESKRRSEKRQEELDIVLSYLDSKDLYRGDARSLAAWHVWDERAGVLLQLGRLEEALESLATAKKGELWELRQNGASQDMLDIVEESREKNIQAIRERIGI
ncbi:MAG: hypothetical protein ACE5Q6_11500 [Dehalococcoidia bacterium]